MTTTIERAIACVRAMDPALQGSRGSDATFNAAVVLVRGFSLSEDTALEILADVHNPVCDPPWSTKELRHKVKSAAAKSSKPMGYMLQDDERRKREWRERNKTDGAQVERLDLVSYHNITTKLRELCGDFTEVPDALEYLDRRCLIAAAAKALVFALPPREQQGPIVAELSRLFEVESLVRAGLLWKDSKTGTVENRWLTYADHRLCIPWQAPDGRFDVVQRRRLNPGDRPYVFPPGMRPTYPFGAEQIAGMGPDTAIAWCEGALDVMSLRLIVRRDGFDTLPLGLPGVDGWRPEWARFCAGKRVLVALDADTAGDEKSEGVAMDLVGGKASSVDRWRPPGKDWNASLPGVRKLESPGCGGHQ